MENDQHEMNKIFNKTYNQIMRENRNMESFIESLDKRINKYLDEREEEIRTPIEKMINDFRLLTE